MDNDFKISSWDKEVEIKTEKPIKRRRSECLELNTKAEYRRAFSETQLLDITPKFKDGYTYNYITGGDVDALSYLKLIIRQQKIEYCLLSTWVMACDDIMLIEKWIEEGKLNKVDFYLGEVFPNQYVHELDAIKKLSKKYGSKIVIFRNHSKIFAGYGDKFYFGIQTSANINTNPRTENGSITISKEIYTFYKNYFDGIVSFNIDTNK